MSDTLLPAWKKARYTDRWTEILFKALSARVAKRWRFVSFRGEGGGEWRGVVDVLAIRKNTSRSDHDVLRSGDLFDLILVQMKGGTARKPKPSDLERLKIVAEHYHARGIVLFAWKRGEECKFSRLVDDEWKDASAMQIFG